MDDNRLTKKVFHFDDTKCVNNWSSDVKQILSTLGIIDRFHANACIDIACIGF